MFCKTCGSLLLPRKTPYGKWMSCPNGHSQPVMVQDSETIKTKNNQQTEKITISDGINPLAVYEHRCKKCGYNKAELKEIAPSYSDEDGIYRMKCGKCGNVEQLEGKIK